MERDLISVWIKQEFRVDADAFDTLDSGLRHSICDGVERKLASFNEQDFLLREAKHGPAVCQTCIFWRDPEGCQRDLLPPEGGPCIDWEYYGDDSNLWSDLSVDPQFLSLDVRNLF